MRVRANFSQLDTSVMLEQQLYYFKEKCKKGKLHGAGNHDHSMKKLQLCPHFPSYLLLEKGESCSHFCHP